MVITQIDNIIAAWDFTRLTPGDVVLDVSGNGNTLTNSDGNYVVLSGPRGAKIARHYDNPNITTGNGVNTTGNAFRMLRSAFSHNLSASSWSMAGWFYGWNPYQYDGWFGVSNWHSDTNSGIQCETSSQTKPRDKIDFRTYDTTGAVHQLQSSVVNAGTGYWYHIGITYDHDTKEKKIYYNGSNVGTATATHDADIRWTGDYIHTPCAGNNYTNMPAGDGATWSGFSLDTQIITNDVMVQADFDILYAAGVGLGYQWNEFGSHIKVNAGTGTGYGCKIQINNTDASTGRGKDIEVGV